MNDEFIVRHVGQILHDLANLNHDIDEFDGRFHTIAEDFDEAKDRNRILPQQNCDIRNEWNFE